MPLIRKPGNSGRNPDSAPAAVLDALRHGNVEERWAAARTAAGMTGGLDALGAALPAEPDARVRAAMLTSLARIGSTQAVGAIVPLLHRDDASVRTGALDALRAMPEAVRQHLPALLSDPDSDVRLLCCEIARGLPNDEATSILCAVLAHEPEANVCAAAIEVLAEVGSAAALPALDACAARFSGTPFIGFAIRIARDQIVSQSMDPHG